MTQKVNIRELDRYYRQEQEVIKILQVFIVELRSGKKLGEIRGRVSDKLRKKKFNYFPMIAFVGQMTVLVAAATTDETAQRTLAKTDVVRLMRDWSPSEMRVFCRALDFKSIGDITNESVLLACRRLPHLKTILVPGIAFYQRVMALAEERGVQLDMQAPYRRAAEVLLAKLMAAASSDVSSMIRKRRNRLRVIVNDVKLTASEMAVICDPDDQELVDNITAVAAVVGAKLDERDAELKPKSLTQWAHDTGFNVSTLDWHPIKNGNLTPESVTANSKTSVYWLCRKCGHEWESAVSVRTARRSGCRNCSNARRLGKPKGVQNLRGWTEENGRSDLLEEWHPSNQNPPEDYAAKSGKNVQWRCRKNNCRFEWTASIDKRTSANTGCPACAGKKVTPKNCLAATHPDLVPEWDTTRNEKSANQYTYGSYTKVWWLCSKPACGHRWQARIYSRAGLSQGCPVCACRSPSPTKNLAVCHPKIAEEWSHRNPYTAADVTPRSNKKVWWCCSRCQNLWEAVIYHRTKNATGCPLCFKIRIKRRMDKRRSRRRGESNIKMEV